MSDKKPYIVIDDKIPFVKGLLEGNADVKYLPASQIDRDTVKDADAVVVRTRTRCDASLLQDSNVKLVVTATIGTDHIDIPWCETHGIKVKSAPGCNAPGVAQYVLASILHAGFNPELHTLGIVGHGNVGSILNLWCRQMGIKTMVCDPPREKAGKKDVEYHELNGLLENCDAISLHVPLTLSGPYATLGMIGGGQLERMKPGAILINSSRGGTVKEEELLKHLVKGRLKAVIDTWEDEPDVNRDLLKHVEIGTPHIAGYSFEGKKRATLMALKAIGDFFGFEIGTSNLILPKFQKAITTELILNSYNPEEDYRRLLQNPSDFERLRNDYNYRHEPGMY